MTIVDFLNARLDEDEAVARRVPQWQAPTELRAMTTRGSADPPFLVVASERVLRDVTAKRQIIELHPLSAGRCEGCGIELEHPEGCLTLRALTLTYVDHPDYDPAWAPSL